MWQPFMVTSLGQLEVQPAWAAWQEVSDAMHRDVDVVVELKPPRGGTSGVYRLRSSRSSQSLIAKGVPLVQAEHEAYLYERVLPALSAGAPRLLSFVRRGDTGWLFMEDAGDRCLDWNSPRDRRLAAHWLARLHVEAREHEAVRRLPDASAHAYETELVEAIKLLQPLCEMRPLDARFEHRDVAMAREMVRVMRRIANSWGAVAEAASIAPPSLAHGDFVPKNVRVRERAAGLVSLAVLDWETAGFGATCTDLGHVDAFAYAHAAPEMGLAPIDVRRLALAGQVLRLVRSVWWSCAWLDTPHPQTATRCLLPWYVVRLTSLLQHFEGVGR